MFLTSTEYFEEQVVRGFVMCYQCGRFVCHEKGGLAWHVKTKHRVASHAEAYDRVCRSLHAIMLRQEPAASQHREEEEAAAAAAPVLPPNQTTTNPLALAAAVVVRPNQNRHHKTAAATLDPYDLERAMKQEVSVQALVAEGKVRSLGTALDACRSGDLDTVCALYETQQWDPTQVVWVRERGGWCKQQQQKCTKPPRIIRSI